MGLGIYVFLLSLLSSIARGENYSADTYGSEAFDYYSAGNTSYEIGTTTKSPLTIEELKSTISELKNPSIEALLPELQKKDPNMFNDYVAMYGSRSLQGSSFQNPRAMLVSKRGELIVTFNGNSDQKGFNELEVMYFDRKENRFNFQEISFAGGKVAYSAVNPKKCLACHQSPSRNTVDPRPNWEAYNVWPGAYNSVGHISPVTDPNYSPTAFNNSGEYQTEPPGSKYNPFLAEQRKREEAEGLQFSTQTLPGHARYKYLVPFKNWGSEKFPDLFNGGTGLPTPNNMPTRLTQTLQVLNGRRMARMIQTDYPEIFSRYKYAILAAAKCYKLPLPQNVIQWHAEQLKQQSLPEAQIPSYKQIVRLENAIDFIFKAYGVDTSDWSMDFNTGGNMAMTDKYGIPGGYLGYNPALAGGLNEVWQLPEFDPEMDDCSKLTKKSMAVLSEPLPNHYSELEAAEKPLINRCISCHVELMVGPYIPFDDPSALQVALKKDNGALYKKIQYRLGTFPKFGDAMPPQGYVKVEQKQKVMDYITSLYGKSL